MIWLANDCLVFQMANGESIPFSSEMITVELIGDVTNQLDPEVVRHAAASVFHYFKKDLGREKVTVGEFTTALEKALRGLGLSIHSGVATVASEEKDKLNGDLSLLARESGDAGELIFYPRLRDAMRGQLQWSPRLVRFRGLRSCVKELTGARRWGPRCESLRAQIVEYLRQCLTVEASKSDCTLVVE